ncbi:MAG TPA: SOS response-associated peptidase [Acidimicrobiia bacterium]
MCGRFVAVSSPQLLAERFGVQELAIDAREPDYNVTPRALVPVVRCRRRAETEVRVLSLVRWGLVPSWAERVAIGDRFINVRAETISDKPAFARVFRRRRCIVPADAFYEWGSKRTDAPKQMPRQPYLVCRRDREPLAFAGLWEIWRDPHVADNDAPGAWVRSCAIITTKANQLVGRVHDRMPVVLSEAGWARWLDPATDDVTYLESLLVPAPAAWFEMYPVSPRVNRAENNDPELLQPVDRAV